MDKTFILTVSMREQVKDEATGEASFIEIQKRLKDIPDLFLHAQITNTLSMETA